MNHSRDKRGFWEGGSDFGESVSVSREEKQEEALFTEKKGIFFVNLENEIDRESERKGGRGNWERDSKASVVTSTSCMLSTS